MSMHAAAHGRPFGQEKFRLAVEASPAAMILVDHDGGIEFVNAETEHMFGYASDELLGKSVDILLPTRIRDMHSSMRASFLAEPSKRPMGMGRDLKAVRKDGAEFPVEVGLTPVETEDGLLVLATVLDITARREAEDALSRRAIELEKANERLARFAYVASHDLQEPLRKIISFSELLNEAIAASDQAEIKHANEVLRSSALRARELVDDLLTYSRTVNAQQRPETLDMREAIETALDDLSIAIKEAGAEVEVDVARRPVRADRLQFIRLVQNLVANAIKYRKPGQTPQIHVTTVGDERSLRLTVSDNGIGIEPKYHASIFEPFKRLHPRAQYPGTGIGLAICQSIADRHGWTIAVKSQLGGGSTFVVTIPCSGGWDHGVTAAEPSFH